MKKRYFQVLLIFLILHLNDYHCQEYNLTNTFSMADGLPSNHVYDVVEDLDGFLWVATDNGVSRFDGKRFINYTTKDGLPSMDAIQVHLTKEGTVWVNCFRQPPSYFDVQKNKFVCIDFNKKIQTISSDLLTCQIQESGDTIVYNAISGYFVLLKNKVISVKTIDQCYLMSNSTPRLFLKGSNSHSFINDSSYYEIRNEKNEILDKFSIAWSTNFRIGLDKSNFIFFRGNTNFTSYSGFDVNALSYKKKVVTFPFQITDFKIKEDFISILDVENHLYFCDVQSLEKKIKIKLKVKSNSAYLDKKKIIWVATLNEGLQMYSKSEIKKFEPWLLDGNYTSVLKTSKKGLFVGNNLGEVFQFQNQKLKFHDLANREEDKGEKDIWVLDLVQNQNDIYAFLNKGYIKKFGVKKQIKTAKNKINWLTKSAIYLNDRSLIIGCQGALLEYNILTKQYNILKSEITRNRFTEIVRITDSSFYFVGNLGLSHFNTKDNSSHFVIKNETLKQDRVTEACVDEKNQLWFATAKGFLNLRKNSYSSLKSIFINENITDLIAKDNRIWIATKSGVFVLDYKSNDNWKLNRISKSDGLSSNTVNRLTLYEDTLYLATAEGVTIIPANIAFAQFEVKVSVISISSEEINIGNGIAHNLKPNQKNVLIQLAGIDLTGHFEKFQYAIGTKNNWTNIEGNFLNIALENGANEIYIRAIDINGNISEEELVLKLYVEYPFYYRRWFIGFTGVVFTFLIFGFFAQRKNKKQKMHFEQQLQLEKQRNKITADLHDDIGATLSSLQINSSVANQLMNKNPNEAHKVLIKIEDQSQGLADKIGDIIWSMKPGEQEFMNLSSRIKNFASNILEAKQIAFKITVDQKIDKELSDFDIRKNLVMIAKEGINNAAKYSKAKLVVVDIRIIDSKIHLLIKDDGVGFDSVKIVGNGIENMRNRLKDLKGEFTLQSELNKGTVISAIIPCP